MLRRFRIMLPGVAWVFLLTSYGSDALQSYPLATLSGSGPRHVQQEPGKFDRDVLIAAAREIMASARYCALITTDSAGRTHSRTMDPFPPEGDLKVWLGTNARSRKVREIRRNPKVTLYYFVREDQAYVSITGIARLVNDPEQKANRFKDDWKSFYPDRARDYLLIEVTPDRLEVVSVKKGIVGDERNWQTPSVNLVTRKVRKLKPRRRAPH